MLHHPTLDKLHSLKLPGMVTALLEQRDATQIPAFEVKTVR